MQTAAGGGESGRQVQPAAAGGAKAGGDEDASTKGVDDGLLDAGAEPDTGAGPAATGYSSWKSCADGACACQGVSACEAIEWTRAHDFGSERFRVCSQGPTGSCTVTVFLETEGAGRGYQCDVEPASLSCEASFEFSNIRSSCTELYQCNLLLQTCPKDPNQCQ